MAVLPIRTYPDPILRAPTTEVRRFHVDLHSLIKDMIETMYDLNGAGIAAPQVGDSRKVFILDGSVSNTDTPKIFVNPEIMEVSKETVTQVEGCLSFPGISVPVARPISCTVKAKNHSGEEFEVSAAGLYARAIQHEFDHLTGQLMLDLLKPVRRRMIDKKMRKLQKFAKFESSDDQIEVES